MSRNITTVLVLFRSGLKRERLTFRITPFVARIFILLRLQFPRRNFELHFVGKELLQQSYDGFTAVAVFRQTDLKPIV